MGMVELESNNKMTVVSVVNWGLYQGSEDEKEQPNNNKVTTKEQQSNTNKNGKKDKNEKNECGEFVSLTKVEYKKLTEKHGELLTRKMINVLDNYKGSSGKKYKSDYRAILSWVEKKVLEEKKKPRSGQRLGIPPAEDNLGERIEGW